MSVEMCERCGEVGHDRRTLWMACLYEMSELLVPFEKREVGGRQFYTLFVCKQCRGDWLTAIQAWFRSPPPMSIADRGANIPVRIMGAVAMLTAEQYRRYRDTGEDPR